MEAAIIKYYTYEKGCLKTTFYIKEKDKPPVKESNLNFLQKAGIDTIISFDFLNLIENENTDGIKNIHKYTLIDIEQQLKQILGLPKDYFEKTKKEWSFWFQLKNHIEDKSKIKEFKKIYENLIDNLDEKYKDQALFSLVESVMHIYESNLNDLKSKNELDRFENTEKILNKILFERTQKGIAINTDQIKAHLKEILKDLYRARNELQLNFGIFSSKDYVKIKKKIFELSAFENIDKIGTEKYYNFLKYHQNEFSLIGLLYKERRLSDCKTVLTRIGSFEENRVFPYFEYFGTVTSRILVKNPSFQQLKKEYRDVIIADNEKELVYIDYCQFEAGILADIMKDDELINLYNSGDIYTEMERLLNNQEFTRDKCKSLFFLYSYGASQEQIRKNYTTTNLDVFFNKFLRFKPFKEELELDFRENEFISTVLGNKRYKTPQTELEENFSWLVSQKIQGTASFILKNAIIKVYENDKEIEFLLPMHDAVLYQVPKNKIEDKKKIIKKIFEDELMKVCPLLNAKTSFKRFTE